MSQNANTYVSNPKVFYSLKPSPANREIARTFSKPEYLKTAQAATPSGSRRVISKHSGWITVDDETGIWRKNAPEVTKTPLNEFQKMRFKPTWMEQKVDFQPAAPKQRPQTGQVTSARRMFESQPELYF